MVPAGLTSVLARSLAAGELSYEAAYSRAVRTLGKRWFWLRPLVQRFVARFSGGSRRRHRDVVHFLDHDLTYKELAWRYRRHVEIAEWIPEPARMQPASAAQGWNLPSIETLGGLADWLSISPGELDWFADLKALGNKLRNTKLQHYRYSMLRKRSGGVRVIESPKPRLKNMQRLILSEILDRVPFHPAAHGFVKGRSIVTHAAPHVGQEIVLRLDLQDFFPGFPPRACKPFSARWVIPRALPIV